ncbi:neurofilament heavy polypeptide-like [Palaemon carinicauda]|uniref:neurofilament heavy polypeptide-like n=1 Tax=Palaemon carinicauda TaxID=392227 RepID=UPI0035B627FD
MVILKIRELGIVRMNRKAPSPSGEKVSGVKSLALVCAPACLRAVERRSSSPTHQRSPVRPRSPTRQRSPRSPSRQRLSGCALQPVKNQRSPTHQRSPAHQRSPVRQRSPTHPEKVQRLPTRQRSPTRQSSPARQLSLGRPQPEKQQLPDGRTAHRHSPARARKHALVPVPVARPARPRSPAPSRSSDSDARKGSPLPHASIPALPVAPARPSISERLLSLAHSRPRSPTARPSRQHAHSPKRSRGHSPALSLERSPTRSYARSPTRSRAYPPARHSPARSHARAPAHARHHSQPYDRLSPTRERSPTGRSPTCYRATSPARETVFTSSPGRGTAPARVGHTDRKDSQQDASPGRCSQDSPPRKRRTTAEQERSAERSRQSSFSFQEGPVVTTPKVRERPFSSAGIADTASVTRLPWFRT